MLLRKKTSCYIQIPVNQNEEGDIFCPEYNVLSTEIKPVKLDRQKEKYTQSSQLPHYKDCLNSDGVPIKFPEETISLSPSQFIRQRGRVFLFKGIARPPEQVMKNGIETSAHRLLLCDQTSMYSVRGQRGFGFIGGTNLLSTTCSRPAAKHFANTQGILPSIEEGYVYGVIISNGPIATIELVTKGEGSSSREKEFTVINDIQPRRLVICRKKNLHEEHFSGPITISDYFLTHYDSRTIKEACSFFLEPYESLSSNYIDQLIDDAKKRQAHLKSDTEEPKIKHEEKVRLITNTEEKKENVSLTQTQQGFFHKHPRAQIGLGFAIAGLVPTLAISLIAFIAYYLRQSSLDEKSENAATSAVKVTT